MTRRGTPQSKLRVNTQEPQPFAPNERNDSPDVNASPTGATRQSAAEVAATAASTFAGSRRTPLPPQSTPPPLKTTVLIVVNVLPLVFERNDADDAWHVAWSSSATSMFFRTLVGDSGKYTPLFIGCPEVFVAKCEEDAVERQLRSFDCAPVFLDPTVAHRYFQGFCKGVLWPVFHNVVDVYNSAKLTLDDYVESNDGSSSNDDSNISATGTTEHSAANGSTCWRDPASWNPAAQDKCWTDYCSVNRTFAKRIVESYHDGDVIWLHDFHLLMLPSYLLRKVRAAVVALYLHVPFPSSEIFRCLAVRTEILRAMLCADHIGFLIFEHARHFLTSCKRLLGLNYTTSPNGMLVVEYNGRSVRISCSHIEPDARHIHAILDHVDADVDGLAFRHLIEQKVARRDAAAPRKVVIASVDRLEGLTALPLKLRAFDRFLALHPAKRHSVVLVQIGIAMDSRPNDYDQTRAYVVKFAAEINRRWAPPGECVVVFVEKRKTTCAERSHLWRRSDVFLDTCVRSGLSLLPFEYVVAQHRRIERCGESSSAGGSGVMVVSEFASYSRILTGCVLVNPWKTDDIVTALVRACEMPYYEKQRRFAINYALLERRSMDAVKWSERLLADIEAAVTKVPRAEAGATLDVGFGFDYRVMQFSSGFVQLDVDDVVKASTKSTRRLFVFDYGGTLSSTTGLFDDDGSSHRSSNSNSMIEDAMASQDWDFGGASSSTGASTGHDMIRYVDGDVRTPLSAEARANLATLSADPHNVVFVMSTGRRAELEAAFVDMPLLNLVADNGFFVKKAGANDWECLYDEHTLDLDWKDDVKRVMQSFATRTNGAFLLVHDASVIYDYRRCDLEYGEIQSQELCEQLRHVINRRDATVYRGKGFVEVRQFGVSKATVVAMVLSFMKERVGVPDFAFFAGDDSSDELAFKALHTFAERESALEHVFTCTVGMKPSCAKYYVDSVSDILAAIHAVAVRHRLESHRASSIFCPQSSYYYEQFAAQGPLVSPRFVRSLSVETDATELSDVLAIASAAAAIELSAASASPTLPDGLVVQSATAWPFGVASCLEPYVSREWVAVGAAAALGCVVGVAVGSAIAPARLRRLLHRP